MRANNKINVNVRIEAGRADGSLDVREAHNLTVDTGLSLIRDLFNQKVGVVKVSHIAFGSGDTAVVGTDTTLETEVYREALVLDPTDEDGAGYAMTTYSHYLGSVAGDLGVITEAGLFNDASAGTMFARVVFAPIVKDASTWIKTVWEITFEDDGA